MTACPPLVDAGDRWQLAVGHGTVDQCCFDYGVALNISASSGVWGLRIEQPFVITTVDAMEHLVVPEESVRLDAVLSTLWSTVAEAIARKDGALEVRFTGGVTLQVPPDEGFEAWTITGPDGIQLVSRPGGGLAVWGA